MDEISAFINQYVNYNATTQIFSALIVFLFFLFLRKVFAKHVIKLFLKMSKKTATELDDKLFESFKRPLMGMFIILGAFIAAFILPVNLEVQTTIIKVIRIIFIILITWGLYNFSGSSSLFFKGIQRRVGIDLNETVIPFVSNVIKWVIVSLAVVLIISELGYPISGFITGLGLGGLAFALAAQETVANIFGGIVILLDKPFIIGDWIRTPSVEGVVENINLRSTRIRTFAQALVVMPNSQLSNEPITNWTKMGKRRAKFSIGLTYSTSKETLKSCADKIEKMLYNHDEVDKEFIAVKFDQFNDSSLDILVYFFTNCIEWQDYMRIKEDINYKIMEIVEEEKADFAFPSRSLYIENSVKYEHTSSE